jgi:3-methylcrotonyl-CoA carboxylase alpha subunit
MEVRLYAEDPARQFRPSSGLITQAQFSADARVETWVGDGTEVSALYDPLLAKIIAHAPTREAALDRLAAALDRTAVAGIRSNVGFLARLVRAEDFRGGDFDTGFIERHLDALGARPQGLDKAAAAAGAQHLVARDAAPAADGAPTEWRSPWDARDGFQLSGPRETVLPLDVDGEAVIANVHYRAGEVAVTVDGIAPATDVRVIDADGALYVLCRGRQTVVRRRALDAFDAMQSGDGGRIVAPMHGKVIEVLVAAGDAVRQGQRLAVIEAMKMEHALVAPRDGTVGELRVAAGAQVADGELMMTIEATS